MNSSVLLDSHILLWLLQEPEKVNDKATKLIDSAQARYISQATIWELGIKYKKGRLAFSPGELIAAMKDLGADLLQIETSHIIAAIDLKSSHNDPFDNLLVAQAQSEMILFVTADKTILAENLEFVIDGSAIK